MILLGASLISTMLWTLRPSRLRVRWRGGHSGFRAPPEPSFIVGGRSGLARPAGRVKGGFQAQLRGGPLDTAQGGAQMIVLLDGKGFEAALPDMAAASVALPVAVDVGGQQPLHPPAQVPIPARPEDQVEVVGEQAEPDQAHGQAGTGLA